MDPLGRGGWHGEWISVRALKRFAWTSGGHVYAVTTPTAAPQPFAGVRFVGASMGLSESAVTATWELRTLRKWRYPGGDVHVSIAPAGSPLEAAARSALVAPGVTVDPPPARPTAGVTGHRLTIRTALPTTPGVYTASMSLTDRRFGRRVVASAPVAVFVPGDQRATMRLNVLGDILTAGGAVRVDLSVANGGDATWADASGPGDAAAGTPLRTARKRDTRVDGPLDPPRSPPSGAGVRADAASAGAGDDTGDADPVALLRVPLDPGELARFRGDVVVPSTLGRWALVVDVEDSIVGSFAALGNAPAVAVFEVVPPRGIEAVD